MYHYVRDDARVHARTVAELDAELDHVAERYTPVRLEDVVASAWPDDACLLTFDDGLVEHLDVVAPALERQVDACYMHDPLILSGRGGIPLQMAKPARMQEPGHSWRELRRLHVPVLGTLEGDAFADGGDRFWLDDTTAAVGLGYRTNRKGAARLQELLEPEGIHVETYDMVHDEGPDHVLHLQSFLSGATESLYVIYEPLIPVRLLMDIRDRGVEWIAIDRDSYLGMGCNVLVVRPGVVVMVDGVPAVRRALEKRGVEVHVYDGSELSLKGDGGPTCLTAPLLRR